MGIDLTLVVGQKVRTNFTCLICLDLIEDPVVLKNCEHYFCRACIGGIVRHGNPTCPECRNPFNPEVDIGNARLMRMMVGDVQLKCPYNRCEKIVSYD